MAYQGQLYNKLHMYKFGKDGKNFNITIFKESFCMDKCKMKNVVVLRNLPSNLIEEAFVVVKSRKVAKNLERIDCKQNGFDDKCKDDGYIVREAESVLASYVRTVEKKDEKKIDLGVKRRYNMLKIYGVLVTVAFMVAMIL